MNANEVLENAIVWFDEREGGGWVTRLEFENGHADEGQTIGMTNSEDRNEDPRDALVAVLSTYGVEIEPSDLEFITHDVSGFRYRAPESTR